MLGKVVRVVAIGSLLSIMTASVAFADPSSANPTNCWGVVVSQRASTYGDLGQHASSFPTPREGVGNLVKDFQVILDDPNLTLGELASILGSLDGLDATHCP